MNDRNFRHLSFIVVLISALLLCSSLWGCGGSSDGTDYADPGHWLSLPQAADKKVDVFYLYPTAYQKADQSDPNICEIDNPTMVAGAKSAFQRQATAFEPIGNIYAPYYRQADANYALSLPQAEHDQVMGDLARSDVFSAFEYYIEHYNHGRPFILAGHSQGSNLMEYLLSEYMAEHPDIYKRMIAAYVIGYVVTDEYLAENPHLKFARGADDTGVIISYNTEAPVIGGTNPVLSGQIGLVINPITWTREETLVNQSRNLGSIQLNPDGSVARDASGAIQLMRPAADAKIDKTKGVLICSTIDVNKYAPGPSPLPRGIFHSFDYPFYYYNLRENAENRTRHFLSEHQES